MHAIMIICEYGLGILVWLLVLLCIIVGLFVSLFELPKYLRNKFM